MKLRRFYWPSVFFILGGIYLIYMSWIMEGPDPAENVLGGALIWLGIAMMTDRE